MISMVSGCEEPVDALNDQLGRLDLGNPVILSGQQLESGQYATLDIPNLRSLRIVSCRRASSLHLYRFFSKFAVCPDFPLVSLAVYDFAISDAELLESIRQAGQNLQALILRGPIGFRGCVQLLAFEHLRVLELTSDEIAVKTAQEAPLIDGSLKMLSESAKNLTWIKLAGFTEITAKGCIPLAACKNVRCITLVDCPKITQQALHVLSCNDALILAKFIVRTSPYQILLREATKYDRQNTRETLYRQMGNFGTILVDAPTCNPEALSDFRTNIAKTEAQVSRLKDNILFLEVNVADKNGELLTKKRAELQRLERELQDLIKQYDQGNSIRQEVRTRVVQVVEEADTLLTKSMVLAISSNSPKLLIPLIAKLEKTGKAHEPCVAKIIERIKVNEGRSGPIELTFLFTADEIDILIEIGIFNQN